MRIVIIGATGNVGTSLLAALADEPAKEIVAIARPPVHLGDARDGADFPTPPLSTATTAPLREQEPRTGVGTGDVEHDRACSRAAPHVRPRRA